MLGTVSSTLIDRGEASFDTPALIFRQGQTHAVRFFESTADWINVLKVFEVLLRILEELCTSLNIVTVVRLSVCASSALLQGGILCFWGGRENLSKTHCIVVYS